MASGRGRQRMTQQRRTTGQQGELLAAAYLERQGYGMIAKNWRCSSGEIDLIMRDGTTLVFVEVRTRRSAVSGLAEESVTPAKQRRLIALAQIYLDQHRTGEAAWRIDVVAVQLALGRPTRIRHLPNAIEEL